MLCQVILQFCLIYTCTFWAKKMQFNCAILVTCSQCEQPLTNKIPLPCICVSLKLIVAVLSTVTFLWNSLELSWLVGLEDDVADVTTGLFSGTFLCPDIISLFTDGTKSLFERTL